MLDAEQLLSNRKVAYALTFGAEQGKTVLEDLAKFCRANESCFHPDPRVHAVMEGRREVWLRLQYHLNLTPEQLLQFYSPHQRKVSND